MNFHRLDRPNAIKTGVEQGPEIQWNDPSKAITPSLQFCWALTLIMLLGLALRVAYIDRDYYNPDEQVARAVVQNLSFPNQWDTNWVLSVTEPYWRYDQYNFSSYHYLLYCWKRLISLVGVDWVNHIGALRALNGLLGLVLIAAIARATRQLIGEIAGISAAVAAAILPLLVQDAHYLRCEAMLTAGVATQLCFSLRSNPVPRWLLLAAGLIMGWMMASKATMGLALPLLLPLPFAAADEAQVSWKKYLGPSCLLGLGCILGFAIGVPFGVFQPQKYLSGLAQLAAEYRMPMPPYTSQDMAPSYPMALAYMMGILGWGFLAVTGLGILHVFRLTGWRRAGLLMLPVVAALVVFGGHPLFTERSYSPFLPIMLVCFGAGIQFVSEVDIRQFAVLHNLRPVLLVILLFCTLAPPVIYSWQIVFQGFSGREQIEKDAALERIKGPLGGKTMVLIGARFSNKNCRSIENLVSKKDAILIVIIDYYDTITPACLAILQGPFHARILGHRESLFPDLPPCSLHTFISPRLWLLYLPAK